MEALMPKSPVSWRVFFVELKLYLHPPKAKKPPNWLVRQDLISYHSILLFKRCAQVAKLAIQLEEPLDLFSGLEMDGFEVDTQNMLDTKSLL